MKKLLLLTTLTLASLSGLNAQISHGGSPLPPMNLRSSDGQMFVEMPAFDIAEQLRLDSLEETGLRDGYRFAYKFLTGYNRNNSGISFLLPDGTRVWRLGIRSKGAYSLNVLFSEYEVPEGAQVFLYSSDRRHVAGAFNHLNNSERHLLPIAPIEGDELIIEYQEPAHAAFPGRLTVGEVNHAYRLLRGDEPRGDQLAFSCMPALACYADSASSYRTTGRSVVLLLVDGTIACTGVLLNNTAADGKPYLLTASHCLNHQFTVTNPDYEAVAGRIVCFFNYDSPLCQNILRGTEEQSMASAYCRAVNETTDMALLELTETPPVYYRPYYAGWNAGTLFHGPYTGIHHPGGSVKRINRFDGALDSVSFQANGVHFAPFTHWQVSQWTSGCTAGGSSGSPLFDSDYRVIGALSGGSSTCLMPVQDYYYAFHKAWTTGETPEKRLKDWLSPGTNQATICDGLDPYASAPCFRLSHIRESGKAEKAETAYVSGSETEPLFGNNSLGNTEYAEMYTVNGNAALYGTYLVIPSLGNNYPDMQVNIRVYTGGNGPETLLHSETFHPSYQNLADPGTTGPTFQETPKPLNRAQENFVTFSRPVEVNNIFYIAYQIEKAPDGAFFSVFNVPKGEITRNTAWIRTDRRWIEASEYPAAGFPTALFIDPVVQYNTPDAVETPDAAQGIRIYRNADTHTLYISIPEDWTRTTFRLFSADGKLAGQHLLQPGGNWVPTGSHAPGFYIVQLTDKGRTYTKKMLF